jgi:cytohesin
MTDMTRADELKQAIADHDNRSVRAILRSEPELISARYEDGYTLLHEAAWTTVELVRALVGLGADVNACDDNGSTPLHFAAFAGRLATAKFLISQGADASAVTIYGQTPLYKAVDSMHTVLGQRLAELLFEHGADANAGDKFGDRPLHFAAIRGRSVIIEFLLEHGAEVNAGDDCGSTPLHAAAHLGKMAAIKTLLQHGADVNALSKTGSTPADAAISAYQFRAADLLKQSGGVTATTDQIVLAIIGDDREKISAARDGCAAPSYRRRTLLHWAAAVGTAPVVDQLLARGCDVNARDYQGETPLHAAAQKGHMKAIRALIDAGADVNARARSDWTPLHHAVYRKRFAAVKMLLHAGTDIESCRDALEMTEYWDASTVRTLLMKHVDSSG